MCIRDRTAVGLYDRRGKLLRESTTAADGTFSFFGIPFGDYELRAKAQGRTESKQRVQASSSSTSEVELFCVANNAVSVIVEQREIAQPTRAVGSVSTLSRETLKSVSYTHLDVYKRQVFEGFSRRD